MNLLNRGGLILALILLSWPSLEAQEFSGLTSKQYQAKVNELVPKNLRVSKITVKVVDDVDYYSPTFSKIPPRFRWATHHRMSPKRFEERKRDYSEANMKVVFSQQYTLNKETRYVAIWEGKTPEPIRFWDENENIPVNGKADPAFKPFDDMLTKFLVQNQIPGATVAISDRGKLVYSKGFGYSHFEKKTPMNRRDRMRIASLSKPITAVAVLQLVQEKKLSLDDKIFDILQHQPYLNDKPIDPRLRDVTVLHCLQHTGGWDRGVSYDPMFRSRTISKALGVPSPPGADNIIRYMLNQPLDHDPGTRFAYSNFGYCLLGRVIEQIAGETYESHVQKNVLKPVGAKSTEIGESLKSKAKEVFYYGRNNRKLRSVFSELDEPYVPGSLRSLAPGGDGLSWRLDCFGARSRSICFRFGQPRPVEALVAECDRIHVPTPKRPTGVGQEWSTQGCLLCLRLERPANKTELQHVAWRAVERYFNAAGPSP